ncbi:MAG: D-aminoacyl-tRNA deacylase [Tepidisphaerales bacterium]
MICVVQRVREARVMVGERVVGQIGPGLTVLAAVHHDDGEAELEKAAQKLLTLRVFPEADQAYHRDVTEVQGGVLLVPNFTVAADTSGGRRPALHPAARPEVARTLFAQLVERMRGRYARVETGEFGAEMAVHLVNDGPLTVLVEVRARAR